MLPCLDSSLLAKDDIYIHKGARLISFPNSNLAIYGDIINNIPGGLDHANGGDVYLLRVSPADKGIFRIYSETDTSVYNDDYNEKGPFVRFWNLYTDNRTIDNSPSGTLINSDSGNGQFNFEQEVRVSNFHEFVNGTIWTPRSKWRQAYLHYDGDTAIIIGCNDSKHVDGYVARTGCGDFNFPIGDGVYLRPAGISPQNCNIYRAAYFNHNPQAGSKGISGIEAEERTDANSAEGIKNVSQSEFWDIDGKEATNIRLFALNNVQGYSEWDSLCNNEVWPVPNIVITSFDGKWVNLGITPIPNIEGSNGYYMTKYAITPDPDLGLFTWAIYDSIKTHIEDFDLKNKIIESKLTIYPNPTSDILCIKQTEDLKIMRIILYNAMSEKVHDIIPDEADTEEDITFQIRWLLSGVYYLLIINENGICKMEKIIKL
jgi:hypothetical protein